MDEDCETSRPVAKLPWVRTGRTSGSTPDPLEVARMPSGHLVPWTCRLNSCSRSLSLPSCPPPPPNVCGSNWLLPLPLVPVFVILVTFCHAQSEHRAGRPLVDELLPILRLRREAVCHTGCMALNVPIGRVSKSRRRLVLGAPERLLSTLIRTIAGLRAAPRKFLLLLIRNPTDRTISIRLV